MLTDVLTYRRQNQGLTRKNFDPSPLVKIWLKGVFDRLLPVKTGSNGVFDRLSPVERTILDDFALSSPPIESNIHSRFQPIFNRRFESTGRRRWGRSVLKLER